MIILDATTRTIELDLNGAVATTQLPFVASYVDMAKGTMEATTASMNTGASNNTTAVTMVAAPGANQTRQMKFLSVRNADTAAVLLWIQINDNSTLREIWKGTLAIGDSLIYTDTQGWFVLTTSGSIKSTGGVDGPGLSTDNALVRWDGTGGTAIQNSGWTLADTDVLTAGSHIALGANYISRAGTAAGFSLDASNNATLSGTLTVSGTGPHAIGGATDSLASLKTLGTYAGSYGLFVANRLQPVAGNNAALLQIADGSAGIIDIAGSGTHSRFAGLSIAAPVITAGAGALTNAATLYVNSAPTGATNNYALWVDAGTVRLDGTTGAGASTGTLTNAPSAGNPAYWMPVNANGTTYYVPCWT